MTPKPPPEFQLRVAKALLKYRKSRKGEEHEIAVHMNISESAARRLIDLILDEEVVTVDPQYIPEHLGDK